MDVVLKVFNGWEAVPAAMSTSMHPSSRSGPAAFHPARTQSVFHQAAAKRIFRESEKGR